MTLKIVFMGSPEFAAPSLRKLSMEFEVVGVVTQPDRPKGRGRKLASPPVKLLSDTLGLEVIQPITLKNEEAIEKIRRWQPDVIVVAAFGQILRQNILELPDLGCVNVHPSLLPRWRGASPVQAALLNGDLITGVTIMKLISKLDAGPMFDQVKTEIMPDDTAGALESRLAEMGSDLLIDVMKKYSKGCITLQPQDEDQATYAPMIKKEDGKLDFNQPAEYLERMVRAFNPSPGAHLMWQDNFLKIHRACVNNKACDNPGCRKVIDGYPALGTTNGWLILDQVQPAGKKIMQGDMFLRGAQHWESMKMS